MEGGQEEGEGDGETWQGRGWGTRSLCSSNTQQKLVHSQDCPIPMQSWYEGTRFWLHNEMVPSAGSANDYVPQTEDMDHFLENWGSPLQSVDDINSILLLQNVVGI